MMRPILRFLRHLLFWAALAPAGISAQDLPEPMSPRRLVNDFAGLLNDSQRQALERKLADFDRETSTQIAVVTIDDLGDYAPSDFAQRLHDKWGVGREGKNNGILVLVKPSVPGLERRGLYFGRIRSRGGHPRYNGGADTRQRNDSPVPGRGYLRRDRPGRPMC